MAARSIWNGNLKVGSRAFPVRLFSAVQDKTIRFNLLDARTQHRVKQHMVDPNTGREVPRDEIRKGVETEANRVVFLEKQEIDSIQPEPTRDIEVSEFLPLGAIPHHWYERPYYLGPDGEDAEKYFALAEALKNQEREGLSRWVMRRKEYFGSLRERDGYLVLVALRYAEQVVSARDLPRPAGRDPDPREIAMAEQLISVLESDFVADDFHDDYRDRVMKFIEQKAKGQKPKLATMPVKKGTTQLLDALAASLKSVGGKAVA